MKQFWFQILATTFSPKALTRRCSVQRLFLKISPNSQETTWIGVSILIKLQASPFYRTPPVAAYFSLKSLGFINCFAVNCFDG